MDNEFKDLDKMLDDIIKKMPDKKRKLLENAGEILSKQVEENILSRVGGDRIGEDGLIDSNSERYNLIDDIGIMYGSKGGYVQVRPMYVNTRKTHLLENGHRIVKNGTVIGFVNGKHMYRDSAEQCEDEIIKMAEKMIDEVIKGD